MVMAKFYVSAIVAILLAWFLINQRVYLPYRCNIAIKQSELFTGALQRRDHRPMQDTVRAREHIERLTPCLRVVPSNIHLRNAIAANFLVIKRPQEAAEEYRKALRFGPRPELFYNLGIAMMQQGDTEGAIRNFVLAAFLHPSYIWYVPSNVHEETRRRLDELAREEAFDAMNLTGKNGTD
jgi:tetratricopeptide (TPR) repeat protein